MTPLILLILLGLYNAYGNAFMQDDAYISFNYAKWFSRGYGLVWYPGSTEFGFTSFLYTFMIGVAMLFGIPPEWASNSINVASFVGCLVLVYKLSARLLGNSLIALIPVLLLATHHTFTAYATGGLETMWVTMLILAFYWRVLTHGERETEDNNMVIGTLAAVALLSRLDTALLLFPGYVYLIIPMVLPPPFTGEATKLRFCTCKILAKWWGKIPPSNSPRKRGEDFLAAFVIPLITTLGFLLICYIAYGYALPNTFYIKMPGGESMLKYGLRYLWLYNMLHFYLPLFVPLLLIYFFAKRGFFSRLSEPALLLASVLLLWLSYIVYIGGDFMEFRFLVPVLAFYYIVLIRLIQVLIPARQTLVTVGVTLAFLLGNTAHPALFKTTAGVLDFNDTPKPFHYAFVESTDSLHEWLTVSSVNWKVIGKQLHQLFYTGKTTDIKIALGNTGIIPFYAELPTFDILGLNSRVVARDYRYDVRPGHTRIASNSLLENQKVVLNFAFPRAVCKHENKLMMVENPVISFPFKRHETLFLPLGNNCFVIADYVTKHPKIESLIAQKVILRYWDVEKRTDCPAWLCLR